MHVYVFVRRDGISGHNYDLGRQFTGAQASARAARVPAMLLPDDPPGLLSPFAVAHGSDPGEREGELIRRELRPNRCSRLGGVFAFADPQACLDASLRFQWDLAEVRGGTATGSIFRLDMMISSLLLDPIIALPVDLRRRLWALYREGGNIFSTDAWHPYVNDPIRPVAPLWEYLIDGTVHFDRDDRSPFSEAQPQLSPLDSHRRDRTRPAVL